MSQTQIGENVDKLNNVESYILTGNYRQLSIQYLRGLKLRERFCQNKFNITINKM